MTEEIINEMYLLAVKSKLQRGAISVDERLAFILSEFNLSNDGVVSPVPAPTTGQTLNQPVHEEAPRVSATEPQSSVETIAKTGQRKFAEQPEDEGFMNRELESEPELRHIYEIHLTNDPTLAYYELITDSGRNAEYLRSPSMVQSYVVVFDNTMPSVVNSDVQLKKVKEGVLRRCGKIWKIVEPCHMEWC